MIELQNQDNNKLLPFPLKLYDLLENAEERGYSQIVSWQKEGRSFKIHNAEEFADKVMASNFSQTKLKSFQRQLNMYGWKKVQVGPNKGGYFHRAFIRGCPELCGSILRKRVNDVSSSVSSRSSNNTFESFLNSTSNFHSEKQEPIRQQLNVTACSSSSDRIRLDETEVTALFDFFYPKDSAEESSVLSFLDDDDDDMCVAQTYTQTVASAPQCNTNNMNLDEYVKVLEKQASSKHACRLDHVHLHDSSSSSNNNNNNMNESPDNCFPYKLHLMLENAEQDNYSHIVSWVKGGTAFKVHDSKAFVAHVLPMFFDQSKYESFRRQLNLYFFTREARGPDRGVISHPQFRKGERWLCEEIKIARFLRR